MTTDRGSRRPGERLLSIRVRYEGQEYERDLKMCRIALKARQIEGSYDNMQDFAARVGLSLTTVSRWLIGAEEGKRDTTDRILAGLRLRFDDVHRKVGSVGEEGGS